MSNLNPSSHPLKEICELWLAKIKKGIERRDDLFGQYAEECENFFDEKVGKSMWDMAKKASESEAGGFLSKDAGMPKFCVTVNKLYEAVALYGPALYHQNPHVEISVPLPPEIAPEALGIDPQNQMAVQQYQMAAMQEQMQYAVKNSCASVKQRYINWLQQEIDKKTVARECIKDAVVTGIGITYTEMYAPPSSQVKFPRSRRIGWRDLVVDPDASDWESVEWIAIRWVQAKNRVATKFQIAEEDLKGNAQSFASQSSSMGKNEAKSNKRGESYDLVEYWEIYSKNGIGDRLSRDPARENATSEFDFSKFGDFCYMAVAHGVPFPLNLPSQLLTTPVDPEQPDQAEQLMQEIISRAQWPVAYWTDSAQGRGGWPISMLGFTDSNDGIWPMPLGKAAMGELRFVNWVFSFLADKVASSCTTYLVSGEATAITISSQVDGKATPFVHIKVPEAINRNIDQIINFLNAPQWSPDIWNMLAQVLELIDKRTGLTELVYGLTSRQIRSATEANVRDSNMSIRPDDMASKVEDWMTEMAVREIQAAQWFCTPEDVAPAIGQLGAMVWGQHVMTQDIDQVVRGFNYQVAAGSARKPNKGTKSSQLQEFGQSFGQAFAQLVTTGIPGPFNAFMEDMAQSLDLDPSRYMVQPPPPPEQQGPSPEQIALQAKMQELEIKLATMQAQLNHAEEKHNQELVHSAEKHDLDIEAQKEKNRIAAEAARKAASKPQPAAAKR